ncbi:MAG: CoA transferase [Myxococcales bacterium]|nr:CoA transferase [Myxococcales bacterium]MCB9714544.1 CoA transferase [Myxococcales bacterium]
MGNTGARPLDGITIVEVGQLIAGPFAATILGYFGADVIKVEQPGRGDPIRGWRLLDRGTSYWWRSLGRNKRSLTLDLHEAEGRELLRRLIDRADVLVENFRPGVMEEWGLGPSTFEKSNPGLVFARISGYGQTGPYRHRHGYASVCEGIGGFRYVNGFPGQPPVRPNLSLGDTVTGLHAALGIVMSLLARNRLGRGQTIDVAIFESVFNLMESVVPEYSGAGEVREPSGTTLTGVVPTNTYPCGDGKHVIIGGNGTSIYQRLMRAVGRPDLAERPDLQTNEGRVACEAEIDQVLASWCASQPSTDVLAVLERERVPSGPIFSVADMFEDPQYQARELFEEVEVGERRFAVPAMVPRLNETPGRTTWPGPELGEHTDQVLAELGVDADARADLRARGIV